MENTFSDPTPTDTSTDAAESPDVGYDAGISDDIIEDIDPVEDDSNDSRGEKRESKADAKPKEGLELDPDPKKPKPKAPGAKLGAEFLKALVTTKVDGQEEEITVEEAIRRAQKEKASTKRFQQSAEALKKIEAFEKMDPLELLKRRGIDPMKLAHHLVSKQLEWEEMPEKDRQLMEYQQQLQRYKAWEQQQQQHQQQQVVKQQETQAAQQLDKAIAEGFKESGLPKKKFYVQQIAATMLGHLKRTGEMLSPKEAAAKVKESTKTDVREIADQLDAKAIREWLGEDNVKKVLEDEVKRVTEGTAPTPKSSSRPGQAPAPAKRSRPQPALTEREWDKYMEDQQR